MQNKLKVMISSVCNTNFLNSEQTFSDIRKRLKERIEELVIYENKLFDVWINEESPPAAASEDSWDKCLREARECHIFIALYNGNAGWAKNESDIGICHAELMEALSHSPSKVRLIIIQPTPNLDKNNRNNIFEEYIKKQSLFRNSEVITNEGQLEKIVIKTLVDSIICLSKIGVKTGCKNRFSTGEALDWSRLDYRDRSERITNVFKSALLEKSDSNFTNDCLNLNNTPILVQFHAIPASISIAAAREIVGQPFLSDYKMAPLLKNKFGPLHIIGCHKNITESQALKFLGFPDATFVTSAFGIFIADNIQKIQCVFISNCRDESSTRHGLQRFFDWLYQTNEDKNLILRAKSRTKIIKLISEENKPIL